MNPQLTAIIPARAGSKALPNKNKMMLFGKPMIAHTLIAAKKAKSIGRIWVTTDDPDIQEIAKQYGIDVPVLRPAHLGKDDTSMTDVVIHALNQMKPYRKKNEPESDHFVLLQPTCPLRNSLHIDEAATLYHQVSDVEAVFSVNEVPEHPYLMKIVDQNGYLIPLNKEAIRLARRQDFPPVYQLNGAMYICNQSAFLQKRNFHLLKSIPYFMDHPFSIDIDTEDDLIRIKQHWPSISHRGG